MGINNKFFELKFKNIFLLLFFWLMLGYFLGTLTLIWPVRWATNYSIEQKWSQSNQDLLVKGIIVLLIIISFIISFLFTKAFINAKSRIKKYLSVLALITLSGFCVWLWSNPKLIQSDTQTSSIMKENTEFVFGPYPDEYDLQRLKINNFTAVISLLHEAVVPFEPNLLKDEIVNCSNAGIKFINVPMLPWISQNEAALQKLKDIAQNFKGKYYIHCYLGKDRVNLAKRIIETSNSAVKINSELKARSITDLEKFERGEIIKLDSDIYLTPYPTDDEFTGYILNGSFRNIISLFNPDNPTDTLWTNKEKLLCQTFKISLRFFPMDENQPSKKKFEMLSKIIAESERPILIHSYFSDSPNIKSFISYYNSMKLTK